MTDGFLADDEFVLLGQNADEVGIPAAAIPTVRRTTTTTPHGRISALRWGDGSPEVVFLHGGGQNAHTWDSVVLALGVPALAVDLPGHGRSDWRGDRDYSPATSAATVRAALAAEALGPVPVVGMSLGGLTAIALAARNPGAVSRLVVVDVTPSVLARVEAMTSAQRGTTALVEDRTPFDDLEAMVAAATAAAPHRSPTSVRRGVVHNARRRPDGRWEWRYDVPRAPEPGSFDALWDDVAAVSVPVTLIRGGSSAFVGDEDAARLVRHRPGATVEVVEGAGHSVQSDRPRQLASLLRAVVGLG
jgi:pimeloyl-ACP methyl ester carboxylesterase